MIQAARYRAWQFWKLLSRRISPEQTAQVRGWLSPALYGVFNRLNPSEQHHAYQVRETLSARGVTDPVVLQAALLHDAGKSRMPLSVWEKVAVVLGGWLAPGRVRAWGDRPGQPAWWTRAFVNARRHPAWGAELAAAAGAAPEVVELIRRHQDKITPDDPLYARLSVLQAADDSN